jgi:glycogen debranching enzyme
MPDGEMARLCEVPFARYYGSVDATPLFVMLLGEYFERTGDLDTVRRLEFALWRWARRAKIRSPIITGRCGRTTTR